MSNSLKNIHHDKYKVDNIQYANFLWEDCTEKNDVIQDKSRKFAVELKNIAYTSIYYNNTPWPKIINNVTSKGTEEFNALST